MQTRGIIPNSFTMANLLCGSIGIYALFATEAYLWPAGLVVLAAVFDLFDGMLARLLKVDGALGKQLDSLADAVTFGVLPAIMMVHLVMHDSGWSNLHWSGFLPLILAIASVYRLAKFNVETRPADRFYGLPTPANALFWSVVAVFYESGHEWSVLVRTETVVGGAFLMALWMVSNVPMLSFKMKGFGWADNRFRYVLLLGAALTLGLSYLLTKAIFPAVPIVLLLYLLVSLMDQRSNKSHEVSRRN